MIRRRSRTICKSQPARHTATAMYLISNCSRSPAVPPTLYRRFVVYFYCLIHSRLRDSGRVWRVPVGFPQYDRDPYPRVAGLGPSPTPACFDRTELTDQLYTKYYAVHWNRRSSFGECRQMHVLKILLADIGVVGKAGIDRNDGRVLVTVC